MARTSERFIEAHNKFLAICAEMEVGDSLPSENALATTLDVSRTVVRRVLAKLDEQKIVSINGKKRTLLRLPKEDDTLSTLPTLLGIDELETKFLDWVLRMDVPQGEVLNVTKLSKFFTVAPHTLQEFFSSLSRFGIVVRRPKGGWVLHGFTPDYAVELSDFRTLLELNSVKQLIALPAQHQIWCDLDTLEEQHQHLLRRIDTGFHDFSQLDEKFHATINSVVTNRFVNEFQKVISLIFHYHFQWNKSDERLRNEAAINEHIAYIEALRSRDLETAQNAALRHLTTSKKTLLKSLEANGHSI